MQLEELAKRDKLAPTIHELRLALLFQVRRWSVTTIASMENESSWSQLSILAWLSTKSSQTFIDSATVDSG